jgi:hypothetical protein
MLPNIKPRPLGRRMKFPRRTLLSGRMFVAKLIPAKFASGLSVNICANWRYPHGVLSVSTLTVYLGISHDITNKVICNTKNGHVYITREGKGHR